MATPAPRIGFVFLTVFSAEGGIQSYVKDILSAYVSQAALPAADVFLLRDRATDPNPFAGERKLRFYYLGTDRATLGRLHLAARLTQKLLQRQYRRVICGHVLLSPLVGTLCQLFRVPYTVMTYGKEVWTSVPPWQQRSLQQAADLWTISRYSRDLACQANNLPLAAFHMVPCVVDGRKFTPAEKNQALVERYGLQGQRVLMTVARLWSGDIYKGVDMTIRALPEILKLHDDVKYLVIGRGDDQPRLAALAKDSGVGDRVIFAGFVSHGALVDHYRLADVYVMPSREGFGIVYLEAMACGVPVIAGDDDGSADPLQDGAVGWRVPYRDPAAVAQACIAALRGEDRRCHGPWLREQTLQHFSPESLQRTVGELLSQTSVP